MNKITKLIKATGLLLRRPYLLNKVIDDNEAWKARLERSNLPTQLPEVRLRDLSAERTFEVKPFAFMEGGSLPTDLGLLKLLAAQFDHCRYFEIGTWRGESVANLAEVAKECCTLNLPQSEMRNMGLPEEYIKQHAMFSAGMPDVQHLEGDSRTYDFSSLNGPYDLIFIDGDHHYDSIKNDTEKVFRHLVHPQSIVVWHDYAWQPGNVRHETLAAILDGLPPALHGQLYAVRNTMCAIHYPAGLNSQQASVVAKNDEAFTLRIRYE